ncbi:PP-loop family protein [Desulfovibrio sp. SGI.169]|uniref:PP-loop family protein n=1 Tax=Desulfovibrio sp. SGI.169 TaxID=3420561 RepID=UPI003CFE91DF
MVGGPAALPEDFVRVLRALPPLAVALSGGLDSRFLCHAARLCGCDVLALHARGPHIPPEESAQAAQWARDVGLPLLMLDFDPLALPEVARNSRERCHGCKKELIAALRALLRERRAGESRDRLLCDGSNADDLRAFRPGLRALAEARVRSPLAEAGLGKPAIRALAAATGLDRPEQQARPCLLTRLAYGLSPDAALLARLARAEAALARLPAPEDGWPALGDFRLRLRPAPLLQVTRLPEALRPRVEALLAAHGFAPCDIRRADDISGFFDAPQCAARSGNEPGLDFMAKRV